jgi:SAM-dependent methyltransferase
MPRNTQPSHGLRPFLISPSELEIRRVRCRPELQELSGAPRESVACCNLCGSSNSCLLGLHDRYGLPLRTVVCVNCGLIYLADRFSPEGYASFYHDGAYRRITSAFAGSVATMRDLQADQAQYAANLVRFLEGRLPRQAPARLLDIGGSSGEVAYELKKRLGVDATVLDPSADEIEAACRLGLRGIVGSAETWDTAERFDVVLLCRTIEHLYDLKGTFAKIRRLLAPGGLFFCDFLDYIELCRITGHPQTVSKVDHCHWIPLLFAPSLFRSLGFEIVSMNLAPRPQFVGLLLRLGEAPTPQPAPWHEMTVAIRELQQISSDWLATPGGASSISRRVRRRASRLARRVAGTVFGPEKASGTTAGSNS